MWKLASKTIKEGFKSKVEEDEDATTITKQRKPTSEYSIKKTKEEKLECPICWESFNVIENVPYVLWCGHTICKYCLLGLQRAVLIKTSALPFQLPFFVSCPWCNFLSLRLISNGTVRFPSKNYYLLSMVESKNDYRSESSSDDNKRVSSGQKKCGVVSNTGSDDQQLLGVNRGYFRTGRVHDLVCKSKALVGYLLKKLPLVVMFLLIALYAIPVSSAVLGIYFFVTFALAVPSFLVLFFAFPSLNWLIREIAA
ncbi:unnamed protein product [Cochlearia groenlandica]